MNDYSIKRVAKTGEAYDEALFQKVIALRNASYDNDPELESADAIKYRLSGKNLANDPVDLEIFAIQDALGEVKGFSIVESYLDEQGKPVSGCMTYANADPAFARSQKGISALEDLHKHSVDGRNYPVIVEVNPGDRAVLDNAKSQHHHPFSLANNDDPLVVEMAIKLGVDPATIPKSLLAPLEDQANRRAVPQAQLSRMIKEGQLKDRHGKVTSAILPAPYNALNLQDDAMLHNPFKGGPDNLHLALVNVPNGVDFTAAEKAYCNLCQSIMAGNNSFELNTAKATELLELQQPYKETRAAIGALQALHEQASARNGRVGEQGGTLQR